jgi:hypothetical protein
MEEMRVLSSEPPGYYRLFQFAEQVEQGETPDQDTLRDLAVAFRKMLAEVNLKKRPAVFTEAMNLKGSKGKNPPTENEDAPKFEAAVKVFLLDPAAINQPWAVGQIAEETGLDDSTIRRYVREHRNAQSTAKWILRIQEKHKDK